MNWLTSAKNRVRKRKAEQLSPKAVHPMSMSVQQFGDKKTPHATVQDQSSHPQTKRSKDGITFI